MKLTAFNSMKSVGNGALDGCELTLGLIKEVCHFYCISLYPLLFSLFFL